MRVQSLVLCGVAVMCLTGCPSFSTMGLARPLKPGSMQIVIAPEAEGGTINGPTGQATGFVPQGELALRYGVNDWFELGAKIWLIGAALEGKFGLLRSPTMDGGLDLSVAPSLSYLGITSSSGTLSLSTISVPLLVGINFGGNQLVLAPKVVDVIGAGPGGISHLITVGTSLGLALKLGPEFRLMPEITLIYPTAGQSFGGILEPPIVQLALGMMFGGSYEASQQVPPP